MLTPRSLQNPSPAVFTWHAAHTLRRSASSVISLNMSFPWDTILLLILMCLLTPWKILHFPSFTLHMAFIQQNLCFADFTLGLAHTLMNHAFSVFTLHVISSSIIFTLYMVLHYKLLLLLILYSSLLAPYRSILLMFLHCKLITLQNPFLLF